MLTRRRILAGALALTAAGVTVATIAATSRRTTASADTMDATGPPTQGSAPPRPDRPQGRPELDPGSTVIIAERPFLQRRQITPGQLAYNIRLDPARGTPPVDAVAAWRAVNKADAGAWRDKRPVATLATMATPGLGWLLPGNRLDHSRQERPVWVFEIPDMPVVLLGPMWSPDGRRRAPVRETAPYFVVVDATTGAPQFAEQSG